MRRTAIGFCLLASLAACDGFSVTGSEPSGGREAVVVEQPFLERSEQSFENEAFFARVEANLTARGLLRIDGGGPDVPFTDEMVTRNFLALAFSEEFSGRGGRLVRQTTASTLHRWETPVLIETIIGPSVQPSQDMSDRALIASYAARLARTTGHPMGVVQSGGNFRVLILNDQELQQSGDLLKRFMPEISAAQIQFVEAMSRDTYCVVFASDPAQDGKYERAVAVIRAELPERLRTSCFHEEIAQGLGLANDSPNARPSIFNDDDEFGRLTNHDELLLQLLYDPNLQPGMSGDTAAPVVRRLATDLMSPTT